MKLTTSVPMLIALFLFSSGCGAPPEEIGEPETVDQAVQQAPADCTFSRGVTTCVTVTQRQVSSTHVEVTRCVFGPPTAPPMLGRRTQTFAIVTLVTETTTTRQHGRQGKVFDTRTETQSQLISADLISDTGCQPA